MQFALALRCPIKELVPSSASLKQVFEWYMSLAIPYETLSNIESSVLIKNAIQMLEAVQAGGGGHCVEHSVLLTELLKEFGFSAELVNADYHDHQRQIRVKISKPMVVVRLSEGWWVCDPYYRAIVFPVPGSGTEQWKSFEIARQSEHEFSIGRRQNGVIVDEDRANCTWTLEVRQHQFDTRYKHFSPFGVTAPFFQILRPVRKSVFYSPRHDTLIIAEGDSFQPIESSGLCEVSWLPQAICNRIINALPGIRKQRTDAVEFLNQGLFPPYYERLRDASVSR